jgi:hypothetical protein
MAMDESNGTCGQRLDAIGVENTEDNRRRYRELLVTTKGLGEYISGAILFEETLFQSCEDGTSFVDALNANGIVPGIKVDTGLKPLTGCEGESWCSGLDTLADRCASYYKQGARASPSGAPQSTWRRAPRILPSRRPRTAWRAMAPSARRMAWCPSSSPRCCSTVSTTSTPPTPWR